MVRSRWKRTLVVTAAWAGLALGQQQPCLAGTGTDGGSNPSERIIVVQESGTPAKQYRVLGSRTQPDGSVLLDVQNTETGEKATIPDPQSMVRPPAGSKSAATGTTTPTTAGSSTSQAPAKRGWLSRLFMPDPPTDTSTGPSKPPPLVYTTAENGMAPSRSAPPPRQSAQPVTTASLAAGLTAPTVSPASAPGQPATGALVASAPAPALPALPEPGPDSGHSYAPPTPPPAPVVMTPAAPVMTPPAPVASAMPAKAPTSNTASKGKDDPLSNPDQFSRRPLDGWSGSEQPSPETGATLAPNFEIAHGAPASDKPAAPPARKSWFSFGSDQKSTATAIAPSRPAPAPKAVVAAPPASAPAGVPGDGIPTGMHSVVAAGDQPGGVRYIPVPMVTVPDVNRPPQPPPNPFVRASAPGMMPYQMGPGTPANGLPSNAFTPPPGPAPAPEVVAARQAEGNAFTPVLSGQPQLRTPSMNVPMTAMAQAPAPTYPAPAGYAVAQANDQGVVRTGYSSAEGTEKSVTLLQSLLTNSVYPSEREWAANSLTEVEDGLKPQVLASLLKAAHEDPAATVRAACVRDAVALDSGDRVSLCQQLDSLRSDGDNRVRAEVEAGLVKLAARR